MKGVYSYFKFTGRNLEKAVSKMQRNAINLYKLRKTAPNNMNFCCEIKDELKIFAIFEGSCYNIEKLKNGGLLYPVVFLKRNTGILIGLIIFLAAMYINTLFLYDINISGSGSFYSNEINEILQANNIKTFSMFKDLDYDKLENQIMTLEGIEFVTAKRNGSRLEIEVRLGNTNATPKNRVYADLTAVCNGEVLSISVIRGTALVKTGDNVTEGQSLIGAYYLTLSEERIDTFVIGRIELKCNKKILFPSETLDDSTKTDALAYAKVVLDGKEILSSNFTEVTENGIKYIEVDCYYTELINGG